MNTGILYIVGTPIGNLGDITYRAVETLKKVDFIAAEDTRVTLKLLNYYHIKNSVISYHEYSAFDRDREIVEKLLDGQSCALVSDAGMPCISDPGNRLVKLAKECGVGVTVVPGPCAAISSLVISGLNTAQFVFEGFLSTNKKNRLKSLKELAVVKKTIIFYEAPHKLKKTLGDLFEFFGDRKISIVKEITKIHENVMITTLAQAITHFKDMERIKGEYVLILEGNDGVVDDDQAEVLDVDDIVLLVENLRSKEKISLSESIKRVSEQTGYKKNALYKLFH